MFGFNVNFLIVFIEMVENVYIIVLVYKKIYSCLRGLNILI